MRAVAYRASVVETALSILGFAAASLFPSMAPAMANADAESLSSGVLEEVTVTAQKRETRLEETPIAVSAFTPDFIDRNAVAGSLDACVKRMRRLWDMGIDHFVIIERSEKAGAALSSHDAVVGELLPEMRGWRREPEQAQTKEFDDAAR